MITSIIKYKLLIENLQLADKVYFNNGKLDDDDKKMILSITNGDTYTKIISDIYYELYKRKKHNSDDILNMCLMCYKQLKQYNKNYFPIKNFDIYNKNKFINYNLLYERNKLITEFNKLPSIAIRNMKEDIRKERNYSDFIEYNSLLEYFLGYYSMISNRDEKLQQVLIKKMFKSNITLNQLIDFSEDKINLLGGAKLTKRKIKEIVNNNNELELLYDKNNILVVECFGYNGIKEIGCNSLWCFTYGNNNWKDWNNYSTNGSVYLIINLIKESDDPEFMYVLIKPFDIFDEDDNETSILYNMQNEPINLENKNENPIELLHNLIGEEECKRLFTFGIE